MMRARNHYYYSPYDYSQNSAKPCCVKEAKDVKGEIDSTLARLWQKLTKKDEKREEEKIKEEKKGKRNGEKVATLSLYARVVKWLNDAISPDDTRAYNPNPMFAFACRYNLLENDPEEIYRDFVAYQCTVYAEAEEQLSAQAVNDTPFPDLQRWYEEQRDLRARREKREQFDGGEWLCY